MTKVNKFNPEQKPSQNAKNLFQRKAKLHKEKSGHENCHVDRHKPG